MTPSLQLVTHRVSGLEEGTNLELATLLHPPHQVFASLTVSFTQLLRRLQRREKLEVSFLHDATKNDMKPKLQGRRSGRRRKKSSVPTPGPSKLKMPRSAAVFFFAVKAERSYLIPGFHETFLLHVGDLCCELLRLCFLLLLSADLHTRGGGFRRAPSVETSSPKQTNHTSRASLSLSRCLFFSR